jgi:hypothetical protein
LFNVRNGDLEYQALQLRRDDKKMVRSAVARALSGPPRSIAMIKKESPGWKLIIGVPSDARLETIS